MLASAAIVALSQSCDCGSPSEVGGPTPYVRCHAQEVDPELFPEGMRYEDETLTISEVSRLVVYAVNTQSPASFTEGEGALQIVLGGFAPTAEAAPGILEAIAARGPALLLPGGEDKLEVLDDVLDSSFPHRENLVDLRGVHRVAFGNHAFVTLPGAEAGRYAVEGACGFGEDDMEALGDAFVEGDHLLSWMTPRREGADPLDQDVLGGHGGSGLLARFKAERDVQGSVSAWPRGGASEASGGDAIEVVAPILGAPTITRRGARAVLSPVVLDVSSETILRE